LRFKPDFRLVRCNNCIAAHEFQVLVRLQAKPVPDEQEVKELLFRAAFWYGFGLIMGWWPIVCYNFIDSSLFAVDAVSTRP